MEGEMREGECWFRLWEVREGEDRACSMGRGDWVGTFCVRYIIKIS